METNSVTSAAPRSETAQPSAANRMRSEDFFKLLVTELQQQDPLEPAKTADMIGQVSQIRSIELSQQLMTTLEQMTRQQRTAGASDLLGRFVEATLTDADGERSTVSGVVTGVRFGGDGVVMLELDSGQVVRAADVTRIAPVEPSAPGPDQAPPAKLEAKARVQSTELPKWARWLKRTS